MSSHAAPIPASRGPVEWPADLLPQVQDILSRYPTKQSAVMPLLWLAQDTWDWLDLDVMRLVARTIEVPPSQVHAVASFYTMFKKSPTGKYLIQICQTLSCALVGAEAIVEHLNRVLEVDAHGNSKDGLFTILRVECLASCGSAPMMQINEHFYERLTPATCDQIIAGLRSGKPLALPRPEVDKWTFPVS
jgi:NADH-quinone oxidoreductase E subunit